MALFPSLSYLSQVVYLGVVRIDEGRRHQDA